ncbi:MAG: 3-hydroxybutyryl-CoA dehydrogenase [Bacteroidetes bacterium]|nr:MAG: 3-hydroxybutyryl-CoA dehydrogenase [Bacteroidota bacterium]
MNKIAVIGAGTMGNGIAHVFAQNDFSVSLIDLSPAALEKGVQTISENLERLVKKGTIDEAKKAQTLHNLTTHSNFRAAQDADLVVEAATESPDVKLKIFAELDKVCKPQTILASNTSSISITKIASATHRADKVIGMHFMNPVPIMQLVEVIRGYNTSDQTAETIMQLSEKLGKVPVEVNDYPGFVSNRILMPMINEAIHTLYEGIGGVYEIDTVMRLGMSHPMGPLKLADFIGLDVCVSILDVLYQGFGNPKYSPCRLLVNMVNSGNLGVKSGQGFYDYSQGFKNAVVAPRFLKIKGILA